MELARARESLKIQNKYKIMQAFADLRRKAKMQRQLEREQSGDIPRPSPVGSQAASEDFDAKTANSRTSQFSVSHLSRSSFLANIATTKSEENIMDQASQRPNAKSSAPGFKDGLQIYEKVGGNLAGISQTPGNQAIFHIFAKFICLRPKYRQKFAKKC